MLSSSCPTEGDELARDRIIHRWSLAPSAIRKGAGDQENAHGIRKNRRRLGKIAGDQEKSQGASKGIKV
jgi:hypothetical protein